MVKRTAILFLMLLLTLPLSLMAARVRAVADRDRLGSNESLQLELRVKGSADDEPDLSPLEADWEILGRSQSSQVQIVNGDFSRSTVYSLTLMPRREGNLTIPSVCFGSNCTVPLPIRVTAADSASGGAGGAKLMLESEIAPEKGVSQGQILLTVRLLRRVDLLQGSLTEPQPTGVAAVVRKLGEDRNFETHRDGRLYQVIERSYAIFPQSSGTLEIPPLRFDGEISRGHSHFDLLGGRGERVRRTSRLLKVEVEPPPADLGGRPWLPARSLRLDDDWQGGVRKLTAGEPATRTLTLTAEGLQAAQLPELKLGVPDGFKSYPDQPSRKDETGAAGITGVLQQKIALVPTRPGRYRLPPVDIDWWDVSARKWRRAHLDPVELQVAPATGAAASAPPVAPSVSPQPPPEAPPSKVDQTPPPAEAPVAPVGAPRAAGFGFWPWLSLGLGLGWLATLLFLWRQKAKGAPRPSKKVDGTPEPREKEARRALVQAARNNDLRATRLALSDWSGTLRPETGRPDLEWLARIAPAPLREEMKRLDRALYSPAGENWSGAALIEAIRQWRPRPEDRSGDDGLPDLYPARMKNPAASCGVSEYGGRGSEENAGASRHSDSLLNLNP